MHPINENPADIKEIGPEDALAMSMMQKLKSYSTGCESCLSILEVQAKEEVDRMGKKGKGCILRKRKEKGSYFIEIWKPKF